MNKQLDRLLERSAECGVSSDTQQIIRLLYGWLKARLTPKSLDWLESALAQHFNSRSERVFFARFSEVPRRIGKSDLDLTTAELQTADQLCPGWTPIHWSVDQTARSLLMLTFLSEHSENYKGSLEKLLAAADISEQVAWYQSLPLLPNPEQFKAQAIDGLRTNMKAVFDAIALQNPYPAQYFDELAWNQMVLKALFIESPLSQIHGLDDRANPTLARMLRDYAHERWAAGREVNLQLWRLIGPFADDDLTSDLERALSHPSAIAQQAAALACANAPSSKVQALSKGLTQIYQQILDQTLTWDVLSQTAP